jgi:NAD(P)-dependent dehydrogenase (short-subunit alcohol dehydrogenase family)
MRAIRAALITGASSGIGRALAEALAAPGISLHLGGRDVGRLEAVAAACRAKGAAVFPAAVDVTDAVAMRAWIEGAGALDLAVANAGISAGTGQGGEETEAQVRELFAVNVDGVFNTVFPALDVLAAQAADAAGWRGTVAVIASIAGLLPTPGAPSYGASKAMVDRWTVSARPSAARRGIALVSVLPGFIRTPMTADNPYPMPGLMEAERAAVIILRGIRAGRRRIVFPWWMGVLARIAGMLPFRDRAMARLPGKASLPAPQ